MPFATINGIQLRYESQGTGTPIVFLHGLGSSAADWALQVPAFAQHHRTLTVDLRAHGQSAYAGSLIIEQMAADVSGLLTQLEIKQAHIVGLSMGGCVALALGRQHAAQVRSLVLVNTFGRYQPAGWDGIVRGLHRLWLLQFRTVRDVAALVANGLFPLPEQKLLYDAAVASLSQNSKVTYWAALHALRRFDARAQLAAIRCPTLVVMGDRDRTVPRAAGERLARNIPGAQSLVVANSGHATPMDQAEVFNAAVLEFVGSVE
ncbi:MAG: alpha/beta fold hydrolase [Anaerolineales bacterium]